MWFTAMGNQPLCSLLQAALSAFQPIASFIFVAAVPGAPEVSSELEELAAALRPAEDRLARRREDHRPVLARGVVP